MPDFPMPAVKGARRARDDSYFSLLALAGVVAATTVEAPELVTEA